MLRGGCCLVTKLYLALLQPQGPLSMGFPRQDYGVGCCFLLQGIFLTEGSNSHLLHWQADSLSLGHLGSATGLQALSFTSLKMEERACSQWQRHQGFSGYRVLYVWSKVLESHSTLCNRWQDMAAIFTMEAKGGEIISYKGRINIKFVPGKPAKKYNSHYPFDKLS